MLFILHKNLFPSHIIERVIRQYITKTQTVPNIPASPPSNSTHFLKLPYVGPFPILAQNRSRKLRKRYCNDLDVKLAFSSFKIRDMFGVKNPVPVELRSNVVYKFTYASCNSCYVGETSRHLSTRIREHLNSDRTSPVFSRLVQVTGANFVNFRNFLSLYLLMCALVLKLISCVPIFPTLLNKSFNYAFTIINAFLVRAYKIYSRSVSPDSFKFVVFVSFLFILKNGSW